MKQLIAFCLLIICTAATHSQETYLTNDGTVTFFSKAPLEDIEATNNQVSAALDLVSKKIVVKMNMVDFHFDKSLMEEHFNENYIESAKFPTGIYQGTISMDSVLAADGEYQITTIGEITLHGVTKPLTADVQISTLNGVITAKSKFQIKTADHDIKIPRIVIKNIAEVIDVTIDLSLATING